jgi:hypothetical protein
MDNPSLVEIGDRYNTDAVLVTVVCPIMSLSFSLFSFRTDNDHPMGNFLCALL